MRICFQVFNHISFYNKPYISVYRNILSIQVILKKKFVSLQQTMSVWAGLAYK